MAWIPFARVTLATRVTPDALRERLGALLASAPQVSFTAPELPSGGLYGALEADGFRAWKAIPNRNSFLPFARARWRIEGARTIVRIRLTPHPGVAAFVAVWMSVPLCAALVTALDGASARAVLSAVQLPLAFAAAGYAMTTVGFRAELADTIRLLAAALDAQVVEAGTPGDPTYR